MHNRPEKPLILYFNGSGRVGGEKAWALHGTFVIDKSTRLEDFSNIDKNSDDKGYLSGLMLVQVLDIIAAKESKAVTNKSAPMKKRDGAGRGRGRGKTKLVRGGKRPRSLDDEFSLESAFPATLPSNMIGLSNMHATPAVSYGHGHPVTVSSGNQTLHIPLNSIVAQAGISSLGHGFYGERRPDAQPLPTRSMGVAASPVGFGGSSGHSAAIHNIFSQMAMSSSHPMGMSRGPSAIGNAHSAGEIHFSNGFSIPSSTAAQFGSGLLPPPRSASMASDTLGTSGIMPEFPMPGMMIAPHIHHSGGGQSAGLDSTLDGDDGMETGELPPMPSSTELGAVVTHVVPPAMSAPMPAAATGHRTHTGRSASAAHSVSLASPTKSRRLEMLTGTTPARGSDSQGIGTPEVSLPRNVSTSASVSMAHLALQMPGSTQNMGLGGGITPAGSVEGAAAALASMQGIRMQDLQPSTSPTSGIGRDSPPGKLAGGRAVGGRLGESTFASALGVTMTHLTGFAPSQPPTGSDQLPPHPSHAGALLMQGGGDDDGDGLTSGDGSGELSVPAPAGDDDMPGKAGDTFD
jgi:hypothetical protein